MTSCVSEVVMDIIDTINQDSNKEKRCYITVGYGVAEVMHVKDICAMVDGDNLVVAGWTCQGETDFRWPLDDIVDVEVYYRSGKSVVIELKSGDYILIK